MKNEFIVLWFLLPAISAASVNPGARVRTVKVNGILADFLQNPATGTMR